MKPYYYIYRVGGSHPKVRHHTIESAHREAMRLAAQHPGESFEILKCIATTRTTTPQTFWMDGVVESFICDTHHYAPGIRDKNGNPFTA
jgi:hypothetical protein